MPALIYKPDTESERVFPLQVGLNRVGRNRDNQVYLNRADVSRYHAEIAVTPERIILKDLGSSNHSFVNGRKVKVTELADGDEVRFSSIRLSFRERVEDGSSTVDETAVEDDDRALAAEIAEKGRVEDGVTPARRAEFAQMVAGTPASRADAGSAASLLQVPEGWRTDPKHARLQILLDVANRLSAPTGAAARMGQALDLTLGYLAVDRAAVLEQPEQPDVDAEPLPGAVASAPASSPGERSSQPSPGAPRPHTLAVRQRTERDAANGAFWDTALVATAIAKRGPALSADDAADGGVHVALAVPLGQSASDAALYLANLSAAGPYGDADLELIGELAEQIGIALANARALDALRADEDAGADSEVVSGQVLSWAASGLDLDSAPNG